MYVRPGSLEETLSLLSGSAWSIVAGGTDFFPGLRDRAPEVPVLDISALENLRCIQEEPDLWRLGALATWSQVIAAPLPPAFNALKLAAHEVGSVQIQNRATIAGNLCNASPAADGVPPLLALDAQVELQSSKGTRVLALTDFIQGNRKTDRRVDEIVTAVLVPKTSTTGLSSFKKLGARKYLVISISMVAARLAITEDSVVAEASVSVGSCSEVACRLDALEAALVGTHMDLLGPALMTEEHLAVLSPIDDVRASKSYRLDATRELVWRTLSECLPTASTKRRGV